ncbi:sigma-70 family RNA polymerase sigma factor [Porifericola rhodea]|uniref:RNA polymerase sigma factor n=1 Tax=Porifericola rhodea TaxID=930972 RepID=UPI0026664FAC|nr:sigma-70 family RNA polymerase sigma factor [Porifericola rhodea]WKN31951.1 sigma-70 family RNA polymerase sigma factor [Porifericola rhodea]
MAKQQHLLPNTVRSEAATPTTLWLSLKGGKSEALAEIYEEHIDEMFRFGMALKPNKSFINDCIQEVFVELWKYRHSLSPTNNIKLYLFKSLRNRIYHNLKLENRQLSDDYITDTILVPSHEQLIINAQRDQELQKKLAISIDKLPLRQKEVIHYLFFEKYSYEETSHLMSISIRAAYMLAWKAISSLRKSMKCTAWLQLCFYLHLLN